MSWSGIDAALIALLALSSVTWLVLTFFRGQFWRFSPILENVAAFRGKEAPQIVAIVPARNEADVISRSIASIRAQSCQGLTAVILVDDSSEDETAARAETAGGVIPLRIVRREPPPAGWSGKLWALQGGIEFAQAEYAQCKYYWFTDADIVHDSQVLARLVAKAEEGGLGLTSVMARLSVSNVAEKLIVPAFIFYFAMLYPFRWVNQPARRTAAAAGGSMLALKGALNQIGGIPNLKSALIDDCALARRIKAAGFPIWLGHSAETRSIRVYNIATLWRMVKRNAFAQLRHSLFLLLMTVIAMTVTYLLPPAALAFAFAGIDMSAGLAGALIWFWMAALMAPTIRSYRLNGAWSLALPVAAAIFLGMTVDSALAHKLGRGSHWKGRYYGGN